MRAFEVRRFSPLRCANVLAVVLAAFYAVLAIIMFPIFVGISAIIPRLPSGSGAARHPPAEVFPTWLPLVLVVFYPVIGAVFGWISGGLGALIYNFVVPYTGGIEMQIEEAAASPSA